MKNSNFAKGIQILTKYLDPNDYDIATEHNQFFVRCDCGASAVFSKDKVRLEELGWFITDGNIWSAFL